MFVSMSRTISKGGSCDEASFRIAWTRTSIRPVGSSALGCSRSTTSPVTLTTSSGLRCSAPSAPSQDSLPSRTTWVRPYRSRTSRK